MFKNLIGNFFKRKRIYKYIKFFILDKFSFFIDNLIQKNLKKWRKKDE